MQGRDGYPVIYSGSRDCAKRMFQAEGLRAFWRGSLTSFLKVNAPALLEKSEEHSVIQSRCQLWKKAPEMATSRQC